MISPGSAVQVISPPPPHRTRRLALVGGGIGIAAALIALAIFSVRPLPAMEDKSVAVLPFRNLSSDPVNVVLAEGIEDDIVSRLVKIRDLKVISHLSSSRYPATAQRDLPAIGRSLGVRNVLEGSFNRTANRISLEVTLVDTLDGNKLWSQKYDRDLADAITLQGDVATAIANVLDATISPTGKAPRP